MVKTRHSAPIEDDCGDGFISLSRRRGERQPQPKEEPNFNSGSDVTPTPKSKRQRLNVPGSSSVSTGESLAQTRTRRNRSSFLMDDDTPLTTYSPVRTRRSSKKEIPSEDLTIDNIHLAEFEDEDGEFVPRRSMRERKPLYTSMNTNLIVNHMLSAPQGENSGKSIRKSDQKKEEDEEEEVEDEEEEEEEEDGGLEEEEEEERSGLDMYSRIKRRHIERRAQEHAEEEEEEEESSDGTEESEEDSSEEEEEEDPPTKNYGLRQHRRIVQRYEAPLQESIRRKRSIRLFDGPQSPLRRRFRKHSKPLTPIRSPHFKRKHHATHNSSSTSSGSSDDERRFERRKKKSMAFSRMRCLPMNMVPDDVTGVKKDRQKIGSSLADVDPMTIDTSVTFDSVGGLNQHVQSLKEMVVFPLLYPEVFERFKISPPRGVLFYGPPGTGKTLVARALANECRQGDRRVAFFMRKGADCLSKWVGESERQLRLLFDQAYLMRPSIIFFDEIDGLAPVRSSRQDQIHSSIVSTLLALMDGLDSRGEVVIIGATNRIDSIDPALRRPGRFDREFSFPLPSQEARRTILSIHTKEWTPKLSDAFVCEVADRCVGYCGADLKALCTEAALLALRRQYPQIYASKEKLQLDLSQIQMSARDFYQAMKKMVPAAQRSVVSPGRALSVVIRPLLQNLLNSVLGQLKRIMPEAVSESNVATGQGLSGPSNMLLEMLNADDYSDEDAPCIFEKSPQNNVRRKRSGAERERPFQPFVGFSSCAYERPSTHRPRILICGAKGQGQSSHLGPAILHTLEKMPVHRLDLPALYSVSTNTPEECCAQLFREARRTSPSIIYMPHISHWWESTNETTRATFLTLLEDLPSSSPVLILATSEFPLHEVPVQVRELFSSQRDEVFRMRLPSPEERHAMFEALILHQASKPPPRQKKEVAVKALQVLPVAAAPEPRKLNEDERKKLAEREESTLRELRLFLRDVLSRLANERKFRQFLRPVDQDEVPDYVVVIKSPMDLSTMMNKINLHHYNTGRDFLDDIDLICRNALEYNPDRDPGDRAIRNQACELKDTAYAIIEAEMDNDFEKECIDIKESRVNRGQSPAKTAPAFYRVLPPSLLLKDQQPPTLAPIGNAVIQPKVKNSSPPKLHFSGSKYMDPFSHSQPIKKRRTSRLRGRWNRGLIPYKKKYPKKKIPDSENSPKTVEAAEENNVQKSVNEEEAEEGGIMREKESGGDNNGQAQESVSDSDHLPKLQPQENGPLENGIDTDSTTDQPKESRPSRSTSENLCSDNESIKSGETFRYTRPMRTTRLQSTTSSHSDPNPTSPKPTSIPVAIPAINGIDRTASDVAEDMDTVDVSNEGQNSCENSRNDASSEQNNTVVFQTESKESVVEQSQEATTEDGKASVNEKGGSSENEAAMIPGSSVQRRMTRRMWADITTQKAVEILQDVTYDLIVDHKRLEALLSTIVQKTSGCNVDTLERLFCVLSQCVYSHRMEYDKTQLITDMESEVLQFVRI
ncbi:ATPase family AAA domain-containing protein 2-like isoform X1 [Asterias rubens]|uniref:ATPase family AAA domain-containing protein 2-like isoform X1 n=1 Tax=Asterias rubens TaxID=7604 RepID=UPI00145511B8|nr:ATPase family AAA domain-containing protein 2-like isoform X1 [Asterias rubens]XP_033644752.1 ATPase family AAA domain-containing protein 2-like isoform X1 [Asterias rubens]